LAASARGQTHGRPSPTITRLDWGHVETDAGSFRDAKLWPGGGRGWDWSETGTEHRPGVQPADVDELLDNGAQVIVVGQGQQRRLQVTEATLERIEARGATAEVLPSGRAIERYPQSTAQLRHGRMRTGSLDVGLWGRQVGIDAAVVSSF
jgi:hypothetical protein